MRFRILAVTLLLWSGPADAQEPAKPSAPAASPDGFVPVDAPRPAQGKLTAARLVAIAYGFIWVVLFGYVWSVRSRLATMEREVEAISRRIGSGRRPT